MKKYFSYSDIDGFEAHNSIDEAMLATQEMLYEAAENAAENGEWDDEIESICYGEIFACATETIKDGASEYSLLFVNKELKG